MNKYLKFLKNVGFMQKGDEVQVEEENAVEYDYYDRFDRWCWIEKGLDGVVYEIIERNY